ncbi:MAG: PA0069 family radical SAM protein [Pseudomonadota bacterium]
MQDMFPDTSPIDPNARRGRGATDNRAGRFEPHTRTRTDDGWTPEPDTPHRTHILHDAARTIITRNTSPDVPFDRSINPYKGCEHGCIYCFARPTHEFLGLSAGLDFETRIFTKEDAPEMLDRELRRPSYRVKPIALGTNTDPYQPIEKELQIMRRILQVLEAHRHPVTIVTKAGLITRDVDILKRMASLGLAQVGISVTTLDSTLSRRMEPRCAAPQVRLRAIKTLASAGVPTSVLVSPVIPALNDHEIEAILAAAAKAGAISASSVALRLPGAVAPLFKAWLKEAYPARAKRILRYVREMHGGQDYDPEFGKRMTGSGVYANLLRRRFDAARKREGLAERQLALDCSLFSPPPKSGDQLSLF